MTEIPQECRCKLTIPLKLQPEIHHSYLYPTTQYKSYGQPMVNEMRK